MLNRLPISDTTVLMTDPSQRTGLPAVKAERQRTIDLLCEHFANDALTVEEFEARIDAVHRAGSSEELAALLDDLPVAEPEPKSDSPLGEVIAMAKNLGGIGSKSASGPDSPGEPAGGIEPSGLPRDTGYAVAIMAENMRAGKWVPPRRTRSFTMWGSVTLDFREVTLGPGVTEVSVFVLWGYAEIIVPPGVHVDSGGVAVMGSFGQLEHGSVAGGAEGPTLRIRGLSVMGGVEIWTGHPGETRRRAKRRRRAERRAHRGELGGI